MASRRIPIVGVNPIVAPTENPRAPQPAFPANPTQQIVIAGMPVWLYPSADSQAFDYVNYIDLPAAAAPAGVIIDFVVPAGMNGIIKRFGNAYVGSGFTEGSGSLLWQLLLNTQPVKGYNAIPASLGGTSAPSEVASIRIKETQRVQLVINNVSLVVGGAMSGGRLGGWFYPVSQEPQESWIS